MPWPYARQRPVRRTGSSCSAPSRCHSSRISLVLPTPASPTTLTTCGSPSSAARLYVVLSNSSSRSRPTNVLLSAPTPRGRISDSALNNGRQTTPPRLPFASIRIGSPNSNAPRTACTVRSPTKISPGEAFCSKRAQTVDDDLAGVHADPQLEVAELLFEAPLHRERGVQRPLRVVLERRRCSEGRHHGVAGELLEGAACALDLIRHRRVEAVEERPRALGILLAELGRAHEVGEQHRGDLALHAPIVTQA